MNIARQTIQLACSQPCPAILQAPWEPPELFSKHTLSWRKCGKRLILDSKRTGAPKPILLGPLQLERVGATEQKWTLSTSLLPPDLEGKLEGLNSAFREWLKPLWDTERIFLSRWKSDFRKQARPPPRFWKAYRGKFERTDAPTEGVIMPVVEKICKVDDRVFVEMGMDIIVV